MIRTVVMLALVSLGWPPASHGQKCPERDDYWDASHIAFFLVQRSFLEIGTYTEKLQSELDQLEREITSALESGRMSVSEAVEHVALSDSVIRCLQKLTENGAARNVHYGLLQRPLSMDDPLIKEWEAIAKSLGVRAMVQTALRNREYQERYASKNYVPVHAQGNDFCAERLVLGPPGKDRQYLAEKEEAENKRRATEVNSRPPISGGGAAPGVQNTSGRHGLSVTFTSCGYGAVGLNVSCTNSNTGKTSAVLLLVSDTSPASCVLKLSQACMAVGYNSPTTSNNVEILGTGIVVKVVGPVITTKEF